MEILRTSPVRVILYCDDLSFDHDDTSYKSLKAALDGGIEGRPDNVIFYATSNRRHLLPRNMIENEQSTAINPSEAVEEKVSLSDRFGLWLGFHKCSQEDYLGMIDGYAAHFGLEGGREDLHHRALEWATTRGARSAASPGNSSRTRRGVRARRWVEGKRSGRLPVTARIGPNGSLSSRRPQAGTIMLEIDPSRNSAFLQFRRRERIPRNRRSVRGLS